MSLHVNTKNVGDVRVIDPISEIGTFQGKNDIFLSIEKLAITANVVGYAMAGQSMGYYAFYPTYEKRYGRVPSWGIAKVVYSNNPEFKVGQRFYGLLPLDRNLIQMQPSKLTNGAFVDLSKHREGKDIVYNTYIETNESTDALYVGKENEDLMILFRPLFFTAYLLRETLIRKDTSNLIITAASSRTGYCLAALAKETGRLNVIGLTSPGNLNFVKQTNFFHAVYTYDQYKLDGLRKVSIVDFSGNNALVRKLTKALGKELVDCLIVGATHHAESNLAQLLAGDGYEDHEVKPTFFFAPSAVKVVAKEDANMMQNASAAFKKLIFSALFQDTIKVTHVGFGDAANVYLGYVQNKVKSDESYVCIPSRL